MHNAGFQQRQGWAASARALHCAGEETSMDFSLLALVEPNYTWSNKSLAMQFPLQTRSAGLPLPLHISFCLLVSPSPPSSPLLFFFFLQFIYTVNSHFTLTPLLLCLSLSLSISLNAPSLFDYTTLPLTFISLSSSSSHHRATSLPPSSHPCPCVSVCPTLLLLPFYSRPLVSVLLAHTRPSLSPHCCHFSSQYLIRSLWQERADSIWWFFEATEAYFGEVELIKCII